VKNVTNNKAWITTALTHSINTKTKLYKKWIKSRAESDEVKYKKYAYTLRKSLRKAEADHYSTLLSTRFNSSKSVWANINRICSDKPFDSNKKQIQKIEVNNLRTSDSKIIAESFNNFFCNIGNELYNNSMKNNSNVINDDSFKKYLHISNCSSFVCNRISMNELFNTLMNLKDSKSCSCDDISSHLVRLTANQLVIPLLHIYNLSFEQGKFPSALKIAKVIPVYKKGSTDSLVNYRPISLTSPFAKILERLMYNRLYSYLLKFDILYEHQFGFRKSHSTSMALIDVINMITNKLNCGYKVMGIFMDLQKAFDTVNLDILMQKLENYGVRGFILSWFRSYLYDRSQATYVNSTLSTFKTTTCGVPQGTVLGPLLFLVYINDIASAIKEGELRLFADDSNLFVIAKDMQQLFNIANRELYNINQWFICNKMYLNKDKTNFMLFKPSRIDNDHIKNFNLNLFIEGFVIDRVYSTKYLGLIIDDMLTWKDHIKSLVAKVSSIIGIIYRRSYLLPPMCKRNVYFALVYSKLVYGVEVYANTCMSYLKPLIIKCNSLLRVLQNAKRTTRNKDLYKNYNTLPVNMLFNLNLMKLMHNCLYSSSTMPKVICNLFKTGDDVHNYNTRNSKMFFIFFISDCVSRNSIQYIGPSLWSKLPNYLRTCSSNHKFKNLQIINL